MRTESKMKLVTVNGERVKMYKGRDEVWFLYEEEAVHHLNGHTGSDATELITGKYFPRYPFARGSKKMGSLIFTRDFRRFLEGSEYDANYSG